MLCNNCDCESRPWIIETTVKKTHYLFFFRFLKALCSLFLPSHEFCDIDLRRCDARINAQNDYVFGASLLHLPFVFPLNYLRALRDWPTNPVRLNNLPIIRGPLCFIRRVSNKSHCVFRRAAFQLYSGANARTLSACIRALEKGDHVKKRKRKRPERSAKGCDRARSARIDSKFGWTSRIYDEAPRRSAIFPVLCAVPGITSIANVRIKFNT